jgi:hypothetical protein
MKNSNKDTQYKSLSADTELQSAYDYLKKGEYKLCKKTIEKKFPKLKSDLDKVNFQIVKILLFNKMKRLKDAKKLAEEVKKEILTNKILNSNTDLVRYFQNILRDTMNDSVSALELFNNSIANLNLSKINKTEQNKILKELTISGEFADLSSKVTAFMKNEDCDLKFLTLMKYELVYILTYRIGKFKETMAKLTLKEMLNNYEKLKDEKGFIDILVKYLIKLNDVDNFTKLFINTSQNLIKNEIPFTNAPIEELYLEILFKNKEEEKIVNLILQNIRRNIKECNFLYFERSVNYLFYLISDVHLLTGKINITNVLQVYADINATNIEFYEKFQYSNLQSGDISQEIGKLLRFFKIIQNEVVDKKTNLNGFKSAILAQLMIFHNLLRKTQQGYKECSEHIYDLINKLLNESIQKQSILFEISPYFLLLNETHKEQILKSFYFDLPEGTQCENLMEFTKDKIVFYHKLEKFLPTQNDSNKLKKDKILKIISIYFKITSQAPKLEKGERIIGDDLISLMNEYFFELINSRNNENPDEEMLKLAYVLFTINSIAHERSPYNYDISLHFIKIASLLGQSSRVLEVLKFMNLKGPQFDTVSYIAFNHFYKYQYKPGLEYLVEGFLKWESENKRSVRKTLWKMFTGRNFYNSEELLFFSSESEKSYYKYVLQTVDYVNELNDNFIFIPPEEEEIKYERQGELTEQLFQLNEEFIQNSKTYFVKNQDVLISLDKYRAVNFFEEKYLLLENNLNFNEGNYKYLIDSVNKKGNRLYQYVPGYKNNFIIQNEVRIFEELDDTKILHKKLFNEIINSRLIKEDFKTLEGELTFISGENASEYENMLTEVIKNIIDLKIGFSLEKLENKFPVIEKMLSQMCEQLVTAISELRGKYLKNALDYSNNYKLSINLQMLLTSYLKPIVLLSSKIVDIINANKKLITNNAQYKSKIFDSVKTPLMNLFNDNFQNIENLDLKTAYNLEFCSNFLFNSFKDVLSDFSAELESIFQFKEEIIKTSEKISEDILHNLKDIIFVSKKCKTYIKETI